MTTIKTKDREYAAKLLVGPMRMEVEDFLNEQEIKTMMELMNSYSEDEYERVYPGFTQVRSQQQFYPLHTIATVSKDTSEANKIKQYKKSLKREKLQRFWLEIVERSTEVSEVFFNTSLVLKDGFLVRRYGDRDHIPQRANYPGVNVTGWNHHPHVDRCTLTFDNVNGRTCIPYRLLPVEYSILIYLNDLEGGEIVFINMPQGKDALLPSVVEKSGKGSSKSGSTKKKAAAPVEQVVHEDEKKEEQTEEAQQSGDEEWPERRHLRAANSTSTTDAASDTYSQEKFGSASPYLSLYELPPGISREQFQILKKRKLESSKLVKYNLAGEDFSNVLVPGSADFVSCKRGNLLLFKSTPENLHGVNAIRKGIRNNVSLFYTSKDFYVKWAAMRRAESMKFQQDMEKQRHSKRADEKSHSQ